MKFISDKVLLVTFNDFMVKSIFSVITWHGFVDTFTQGMFFFLQLIQCIMCNLESNISLSGIYYNNVIVYYAGLSVYLCKVALIWTVSVLPGFFNGTVSMFFRLFNRNKNTVLINKHIIACNYIFQKKNRCIPINL